VHGGEAGQRTGGRGAGEAVKQVSAPAGEVLQLARGREIGGGGSSLGSYLEGGDRIRRACTFRPSRTPSPSSSRKMEALTILGLLPRARVETTSSRAGTGGA
jgi:hypothetical protein